MRVEKVSDELDTLLAEAQREFRPTTARGRLQAPIFKTKKGVIGTLFQDMISPVKQRYIEVCSENKIFKLDFEENTLMVKTKLKKKIFKNHDDQNLSTLKKSLKKFMQLVKSKKFNITSFDEALYDLDVCKKMHK